MRLTSLHIKGFKSFADKTVVNFDNDITGIVGPNGCGKSNVVDAIRWVLGEQRAKTLRLEKMDNIIFNGTKDRKAGNLAEVSLTFDNTRNIIPTEFTTVTITRILYRSGESEYKINGVTCRLKDIRNLFLDTGIGSSTYAIMELKMIDDILNDVDNSRRTLIEQAAGISKYKTRKKETLLKLNATEADLNRVEDLLFEIGNNLKSLESQARKALKYKKLQEDYKVLSIEIAKHDILSINEEYETLQRAESDNVNRKTKLEADIRKREADLQNLKTAILEREKSLSGQQKELNDFIASIQEEEADKRVSGQKLEFLKNRISTLEAELVSLEAEEKQLGMDIDELKQKIETGSSSIQSFREDMETAKSALEAKRTANLEMKEQLDDQKAKYHAARNQLNESEKMLAVRESRMESMKSSIQRTLFEKEERLEALKEVETSIGKSEVAIEKQSALLTDLEMKEASNLAEIEKLEAAIESANEKLQEKKRDLDAKQNEFRLTRNMVDSLEGFPDSIKFLKQEVDWLKDAPLLSDLIYCSEEYRVALELALKPWLNHFVVDSEDNARKAIELLKDSAKGRAHFFVADHFAAVPKKNTKAPKGLIPADSVVETDGAYADVLQYLLRDVFIVPEDADVPNKAGEASVFIDIRGAWIRTAREMSGGTVGLFEGKRLGRLKNLEKLEKQIDKLKRTVEKESKALKADREKVIQLKNNSYRKTIDRERDELSKLERELLTYQSRMENFKEFVDNRSKHHDEVREDISAVQSEIEVLQGQHETAEEASRVHEHKLDALENDFKAASIEFNRLQEQFNEKHILFIQKDNAIQSWRQSLEFKESRNGQVAELRAKHRKEIEQARKEIEQITSSMDGLEDKLVELYRERDEMKESLSKREGDYYELKEEVQTREDDIRKASREKEECDSQVHRQKEKKDSLKYELKSIRQRLSLEFKIDVEALLENLEAPDKPKDELELKMERVARRIDNFGEVNPMAEAAYEEMKKRFDFITEQKEDLEEAKESLLKTIEEIEQTAQEHFMEAFTRIRDNFKEVFQSMFSEGDDCDLVLVTPEEPLDSKVEIIAKPKGKRPQSINQLSGGEKSLTSLSLLFALYLYKPAPFCILDEVDAPLDDANIRKFNKAIRQFAEGSQFIVVTHNKMTMAAVDVTYGVTMHKAGISMLVPADFRSYSNPEAAAIAN